MKEEEFVSELLSVSELFKQASSRMNALIGRFEEEDMERIPDILGNIDTYASCIAEYTTYSGDCSYELEDLLVAMRSDSLLK